MADHQIHELPDGYRLDLTGRRLLAGNEEIPLSEHEFILLAFFDQHANEIIDKDVLKHAVWGDKDISDDSLGSCIRVLRKALDNIRRIENRHGRGYIFNDPDRMNFATSASAGAVPSKNEAPEIKAAHPVGDGFSVASRSDEKPEHTFERWRRTHAKTLTWILSLGVIGTVVLSVYGLTGKWKDDDKIKLFLGLFQMTFLLVLLCDSVFFRAPRHFHPIEQDMNEDGALKPEVAEVTKSHDVKEWRDTRSIAEVATKRYAFYWYGVLASWVLLYAFLASQGMSDFKSDSTAPVIITTFFNNCSTAFFLLSYNILNKRTEIQSGRVEIGDGGLILLYGILTVAFSIIEWLLVSLFPDQIAIWYGATLISGILGGIAMALYVGRLQSKFLAPSSKLVAAFYSYTAIQSLFVFLVEAPQANLVTISSDTVKAIAAILITLALILKALLYLYTSWLFGGGRILFYFVRTIHTDRAIDEEWDAFPALLSAKKSHVDVIEL